MRAQVLHGSWMRNKREGLVIFLEYCGLLSFAMSLPAKIKGWKEFSCWKYLRTVRP